MQSNLKICTVYPCTRPVILGNNRHMIISLLAVLAPSNRKCDFIGETSTFLTSLKLPRFEATTVCCEWRIKCHHEYGSYKVVFDVQKHSIIFDSSSVYQLASDAPDKQLCAKHSVCTFVHDERGEIFGDLLWQIKYDA
eukprot:1008386_1